MKAILSRIYAKIIALVKAILNLFSPSVEDFGLNGTQPLVSPDLGADTPVSVGSTTPV